MSSQELDLNTVTVKVKGTINVIVISFGIVWNLFVLLIQPIGLIYNNHCYKGHKGIPAVEYKRSPLA